jgi:hypothetical protein
MLEFSIGGVNKFLGGRNSWRGLYPRLRSGAEIVFLAWCLEPFFLYSSQTPFFIPLIFENFVDKLNESNYNRDMELFIGLIEGRHAIGDAKEV